MEKKRNWFAELLGFTEDSEYINKYQQDANVRSGIYMAVIVVGLEVFMIIRYLYRYLIKYPDKYEITVESFFKYTKSYWIFLGVGLVMLIYGILYISGRIRRSNVISNLVIIGFSGVCLYFGILTSMGDFQKGKMIICFLTMALFVACLLIWKPYISLLLLTAIASFFAEYIKTRAVNEATGEAMELGSGDFINYVTFFISATVIAISIYHQRHRVAVESEKLFTLSITDELTGIPNMHRFAEDAEAFCREHDECIYLFFNIENFKIFNDQMGFEYGNEFLVGFGRLVADTFKDYPYARQADDHFVALAGSDYRSRIDALRDGISRISDYEGYIDVKVGGFMPEDKTMNPLICIDKARYAAGTIKNRSDEHFRLYDAKLDKVFRDRAYVLNNIDKAIREGYIKVYYQPVMRSEDEKLCGCEALVRWIDPDVGFLSPGAFVPILEESRQIHKLDKCVYEIVCKDLRSTLDRGLPIVPVSLNFSRLDFELMNPVEVLEELVTKYDIPRDYLHVEITESALTSDDTTLQSYVDIFHEKGYAVWLDDFGSGYSSLNVLKDFKFDLLKIDMVFLRNFGEKQESETILRNIIRMAEEVGMDTLCEGVETKEAVDFLEQAGCGRLQGYFFGKPMPYDDFLSMIERGEFEISRKLL